MLKKLIAILIFAILFSTISSVFAVEKQPAKQEGNLVFVTGTPASPSHIGKVVRHHFERRGMEINIINEAGLKYMSPGDSQTIKIQVTKRDETCSTSYPTGKTVTVTVRNEYAPVIPCEFLAFSNHPEKVFERGLLYEAGLIRHKPVRLRYYHLTDEKVDPHYVGFYLGNNTGKPARVHIVESYGGPSKDVMLAGHMNNLKFFDNKENNQGWIEEIPPHSIKLIRRNLLDPGVVISATADLHLLKGGPLQIYMYASDKSDQDLSVAMATSKTDRHARGAYPLTRIRAKGTFSLNGKEAVHTIADTPISNIFEGKDIRGNYGVMYEYEFTLKNPYPEDRTASFYFQPRGGIATATFSFDDRPVSVGFTRAYEMIRLCRIKVPAGGSRQVTVKTMPEDASNYPVRLIIQSDY